MKEIHPNDRISKVVPISQNSAWSAIKSLTYSDIKNDTPPPMEYVLYPWLPTQGIAFVYAATGVGKTLFTLNIAYSIASGGNFLKYKAPKPRKILYVDGEMAYVQVHSRFKQIILQQGEMDDKDNWFLLTPKIFPNHIMPKINTIEGQDFYQRIIEENKVEVLVLDNLSTLSSIDENNSEQWKIIQDWLIALRSKGISTIVVHHAGKDKKGYRGTSRMLDCADSAISLQEVLQNESESDKTNTTKFKVEYQKHRSFGGIEALSFEVSLSNIGWDVQSLEKNNIKRITEMYGELKIKPNDIAQEIGLSRSQVYRIIRKSKLLGLIRD